MRRRRRGGAASVVAAMVVALGLAGCGAGPAEEITLARLPGAERQLAAPVLPEVAAIVVDEVTEPPSPVTTAAPVTTAEPPAPAPPPSAPPPRTTAPAPPAAPLPARPVPAGTGVYAGLGTWIDAYDWSRTFGKDGPLVEVADIDRMADLGVQTLYVQTSRWNASADVLEPERLLPLIARARARGMGVVAWYLPTLVDPATDLRRLLAAADLDVDTVAVDIESRDVADVAERNARLVQLSRDLRAARPDLALGGIVFPPVVMDVINTSFWPDFPWRELAPSYDVWLPMAYQSFRTDASGYREGYRYTAENIDRLRDNLGLPSAVVHTVGGIADATTTADVDGMVAAAAERGAIGGSLYDWRTTSAGLWPHLQPFRR